MVAPAAQAALVLALVALAAALMTAWFSWQHRPVPLASSEVGTLRTGESAAAGNARSDHSDHGATGPTSATDTNVASAPTTRAARTGASGEVVVDVAGRVARPGVVRLPAGARVVDAIERAGGAIPGTDTTGLALARMLVDGEQVLVDGRPGPAPPGQPAGTGLGPVGGSTASAAGSTAATGPIDLNAATAEQLDGLPRVGPVLARRIVEWRTAHGPFRSPEQLAEVTGVGDKRLADLLPLLKV
ncbi:MULTISPECIES: helix-hairpin-helix domain-containing protein [unclassified Frankia]